MPDPIQADKPIFDKLEVGGETFVLDDPAYQTEEPMKPGEEPAAGTPAPDSAEPSSGEEPQSQPTNDQGDAPAPDAQPEPPSPSPEPQLSGDPLKDIDPKVLESFNKLITDKFGEQITSVQALLESDVAQIYAQQGPLIDELNELREKVSSSPYANDYVAKLNEFVLKGGDPNLFARVQGVNVDDLEPLNAIALKMKWEKPGLSDEDINIILKSKYSQDSSDEAEKRLGNANLKNDSLEATNWLKDYQVKTSIPDVARQTEVTQQAEQNRIASWEPTIVDLPNYLKEFPIVIDNEGTKFNFQLTDQHRSMITEQMREVVANAPGLTHDKAGLETVWAATQNVIKATLFDDLIKAGVSQAISKVQAKTFEEQHRPSAVTPDNPPRPANDGQPVDEQDFILKAMRGELPPEPSS